MFFEELTRRWMPSAILAAAALCFAPGALAQAPAPAPTQSEGSFQRVEAQAMSGDAFVFPDDMHGDPLIIIGLAISTSQANGEVQQNLLLDWQAWLDASDSLPAGIRVYHFPVIENPPRFIRGVIRRAVRRLFDGKVPLSQAAVLYVSDSAAFAESAGIVIDEDPTLVIADAQHRPLALIKGGPSEENIALFTAAVAELGTAQAPGEPVGLTSD